jgi:hypothetical protein
MQYIDNIIFLILLVAGFGLFAKSLQKIYRNIRLGHEINRNDRKGERWSTMARVAMGQSKMVKRPVAGFYTFLYMSVLLLLILN